MSEFFRGWRRKVGVATLMLSCVFMAEWIRGQIVGDVLVPPVRKHITESTVTTIVDSFLSGTNLLVWQREQCVYSGAGYQWGHKAGSKYLKRRTSRVPLNLGELDVKWHWQLGGFGSCELPIESFREGAAVFRNNLLVIPYWLIVLPLTLISACLLVSKPRPSTQKKIDAPTANEGTTK